MLSISSIRKKHLPTLLYQILTDIITKVLKHLFGLRNLTCEISSILDT